MMPPHTIQVAPLDNQLFGVARWGHIYIYTYIPQTVFSCRGSGGVSWDWVFRVGAQIRVYARSFLCAGCGNGEGRVAPVYAKVVTRVVFAVNLDGFGRFYVKMSPGALGASGCLLGPPGCLLGVSWVPPGCLLGVSWVPFWWLLHDCSSMIATP